MTPQQEAALVKALAPLIQKIIETAPDIVIALRGADQTKRKGK